MKKVKCVDSLSSDYLTDGKVYDVTAKAGDIDSFGEVIGEDSESFELVNDAGDIIFCCGLDNSCHATWELVE